jgi:hypothetical protein
MSVTPIITKYGTAPAEMPGAVSFGGGGPASIPIMQGQPMSTLIVPPGGFAGFAQQTAATQALFQRAGRTGGLRSARKRRRKSTKSRAAVPRKRRAKGRAKKARLVKGSRAAKAYMAKIRRKRKR